MTEKNNYPLYLSACRQASALSDKKNYAMAIMQFSSLQGRIEKDILQSDNHSKEIDNHSKEILNLYLYTFIKLYEAMYYAKESDVQIAAQFQAAFEFLSSLPVNMYTQSTLCHLTMFRSFHMRYHSHSKEAILEEMENARNLLMKTSQSDQLDNSPMYSQFLVESAIYVEKKKLKDANMLLNLFEEALLYLDVYCPINNNVHILYRYFCIRQKAFFGKARCHLRLHETKNGLRMLLNTLYCRLNVLFLFPIHCFSGLFKKPFYEERNS